MSNYCSFCTGRHIIKKDIPVIYYKGRKFSWHKCIDCKLIFILPFLSADDFDKLYGISYHQKYYFDYTVNYNKQINLLQGYNKNTFLDYGCGDAGLLSKLHTKGYQVTGVEYDPLLVKELNTIFPLINIQTADDFEKQEVTKYDVIHLGDVLEHMNDPSALIRRLTGYLKDDGIFFIEGPLEKNPNLAFFFRKITTRIKKNLNLEKIRVKEPYHVTFSNACNQQLLFENAGLKKIYFKVWEHGFPYIDKKKDIRSVWTFLQWLIVKTSISVSQIVPGWGNRFSYIGKPSAVKGDRCSVHED